MEVARGTRGRKEGAEPACAARPVSGARVKHRHERARAWHSQDGRARAAQESMHCARESARKAYHHCYTAWNSWNTVQCLGQGVHVLT